MESLICLGYSIGRKNEVVSASSSLYRKKNDTAYCSNRLQLADVYYYFPSATHVLFTECMKCSVYSISLFIYLSSLALNTTLTETLNSTVLVLDSSQSSSRFPLTQQERMPQNITNDSKLAHSVDSVVQTIFILLLMSLSVKLNITT